MNHIMLDLETLDTKSSAVIISIGAVAFDPVTGELGEKFYVEFSDDIVTQQNHGQTMSGDTVKWWMQQNEAAKRVFAKDESGVNIRTTTVDGLFRFTDFVNANGGKDALIWGNGSDFDNIILGGLYDAMGIKKPWSYSRNRCYRTMKNLHPEIKAVRQGTHHNALDDAVTQAVHLQEIYKCLSTPR